MSYFNPDLRETHTISLQTQEYIVNPQVCKALTLYSILLAGISFAHPPFRFVRPRPHMRQLLLSIEGRGSVLVDGQWVPCSPGMVYITPPGKPHAYYADEQEQAPWKIGWVMYEVQGQSGNAEKEEPHVIQADPHSILAVLHELYQECMGPADEACMHAWALLLHTYAQRLTGQEQFENRLLQLWKQVDANLAHPWTNTVLAQIAGISGEHLRRLCQQQFGHSPMRHVTTLRMQRAMALLTTDRSTIATVAALVGYDNAFAFSTAFKRYTGKAPSDYRKREM